MRIQDRILLLLAGIGDLLEEVHDPGGWLKNYYETLYGWAPYRYKRSNYKATFERMLKVGRVERIIKNGEPCLRITSRGDEKLARHFPIVLLVGKKWRGIGTLVVFDVQEVKRWKRDKFRDWLLGLGAGKVQRSVYLFAYEVVYEIEEVVKNLGLEDQVEVFSVDLRFIKNKKKFARKVWKLERPEKGYQLILNDTYALESQQGREKEKSVKKIRERFLEMLVTDPCLPKEFLPNDWIGEKVKNLVKKLSK